MRRDTSIHSLQVVEMTLSVFRSMFSGGCGSGYLERNPMHIIRLTYNRQFLCYAVSATLLEITQRALVEIDGGKYLWLSEATKVSSKPTCIRQGGNVQVIKSAVCGGPTVSLEDRIEGIYRIEPAMGSYGDPIFLVPPCFYSMLIVLFCVSVGTRIFPPRR